jgi:hypothetical protein
MTAVLTGVFIHTTMVAQTGCEETAMLSERLIAWGQRYLQMAEAARTGFYVKQESARVFNRSVVAQAMARLPMRAAERKAASGR